MQDLAASGVVPIVPMAPDGEDGYNDRRWSGAPLRSPEPLPGTPSAPAEDEAPMTDADLNRTVRFFLWASTRQPLFMNSNNLAEGTGLGTNSSAKQWLYNKVLHTGLVRTKKSSTPGKKGFRAELVFDHHLLRATLKEKGRDDDIGNWPESAEPDLKHSTQQPPGTPEPPAAIDGPVIQLRALATVLSEDDFRELLEGLEDDWRERKAASEHATAT